MATLTVKVKSIYPALAISLQQNTGRCSPLIFIGTSRLIRVKMLLLICMTVARFYNCASPHTVASF